MLRKLRRTTRKWIRLALSADERLRSHIDRCCPGYSKRIHWQFFSELLRDPAIQNICVLGVYHGRDIAYITTILRHTQRTGWKVTGVDKFEDSPGADWPEDKKGLKWEDAGYGAPPGLEKTRACLKEAGCLDGVVLHKDTAEHFLDHCGEQFDCIYIDIAHDYQTTRDTIKLATAHLKEEGVIAGDDFSNQGTWGVARAVEEAFTDFQMSGDWIWYATKAHYRGQ